MRRPVCITIDTEGDSADNPNSTFFGIKREIPALLDIFARCGIRATFFVQQDDICPIGSKFRETWIRAKDRGHEIGLHVHGLVGKSDEAKAETLRRGASALSDAGFEPVSFRAGNFHLNGAMLPVLEECGIRYDSSVVPGLKENDKAGRPRCNHTGAPFLPYHPSPDDHTREGKSRILELPVNRFDKVKSNGFSGLLTGAGKEEALFDYFYERRQDPVIIMVLHSWDRIHRLFQNLIRRRFGQYGRIRRLMFQAMGAAGRRRVLDARALHYLEALFNYISDQDVEFQTIRDAGRKIEKIS